MSDATKIEWTDATWNPVTGCTRVSPGCANCYIERTPPFRMAGRSFATVGAASTTGVRLHPERLDQPLRWRKPRRVFVCSLADLFHDDVPDEYIARVFDTMRLAPAHTFQVLTKRPERAAELLPELYNYAGAYDINDHAHDGQPLPNVWLGVSIENARFTWRADVLREIPAAVRFISAEPLLGSLYPSEGTWTMNTPTHSTRPDGKSTGGSANSTATTSRSSSQLAASTPPRSSAGAAVAPGGSASPSKRAPLDLTGIDWIIAGGESGPAARPFHLEHAREIIRGARAKCHGDVICLRDRHRPAVFVKQLGAKPIGHYAGRDAEIRLRDRKGGDWAEWPADLRVREFPSVVSLRVPHSESGR